MAAHPSNNDGFRELVASSREALVRLALSITHDRQLAEDACQEAYLALYMTLRHRTPISNRVAWLRRVVAGKAVDAVRARSLRCPRAVSLEALDAVPPSTEPGCDEDLRAALRDAVAALPERERHALELRVVHGQTYDEIALALQCSEPTARRWVGRALAALRHRIFPPDLP